MAIKFTRKALIFSMISIIMSLLLIITFSVYVHVPLDQRTKIEQTNVERMENFLEMYPYYLGIAIEESTYDTLEYLIDKTNDEGALTNFSEEFSYCLRYGIDKYTRKPCSLSGGTSSTLGVILENIADQASEIYRGQCNTRVTQVSVVQTEPYKLDVTVFTKVIFQKEENWIWHINYNLTKKVSLIGVTDPLTQHLSKRRIQFGLDDIFSKTDFAGNLSTIENYINQEYFFIDSDAPSFVDILEGHITNGTYDASKKLGLNSFISGNLDSGLPSYKMGTSMLSLDYVRETPFEQSELGLIKYSDLAERDLTFYIYDLSVDMEIPTNKIALATTCNCDLTGCNCP